MLSNSGRNANINGPYCTSKHKISRSSLAKAAGEKNFLLVDTVFAELTDSARLEAKWKKRQSEKRNCSGNMKRNKTYGKGKYMLPV